MRNALELVEVDGDRLEEVLRRVERSLDEKDAELDLAMGRGDVEGAILRWGDADRDDVGVAGEPRRADGGRIEARHQARPGGPAVEFYRKAVAIGPDPHMLAALGDLLVKLGREGEARPLFDQLVRVADGKDEYLRALSLFYADHDRDLTKALELAHRDFADRQDVHGHDALAWALLKNDRPAEAARDANLDDHAGLIQLRLGDRPRAREHLDRALARNPIFSLHAQDARRSPSAPD